MITHVEMKVLGVLFVALTLSGCADQSTSDTATKEALPPAPAVTVVYPVPEGWTRRDEGEMTVFTAPEGDANMVVVPVGSAASAQAAALLAWQRFDPAFARAVQMDSPNVAGGGWEAMREIRYATSPAEERLAYAHTYAADDHYHVILLDGHLGTFVKRGAAERALTENLSVAGYSPESLAGKQARPLTPQRIEALRQFVADSGARLGIPGAAFALIEDGRVVYEGGVGVKEVGGTDPVDEHTLFMIASNTKGMTTLLLAKLVEMGKLQWDDRVIDHYPAFRLGDEATTRSVLVRHLVCACTGLPRKDFFWIFNNDLDTPATVTFDDLAGSSPTSAFGELYQYNNQMAAAAGYVAAHVLYPELEIGLAYDKAMQEYIFDPLQMDETTFSMVDAQQRNHARPHVTSLDGQTVVVEQSAERGFNHLVVPYRPAGGAWSSVHDVIKYVGNELSAGVRPDGTRVFARSPLLERRVPAVSRSADSDYGMGLIISSIAGVEVVEHGGSLAGYKSNLLLVPEAGVGAVILTNGDDGYSLVRPFTRRLIEVLYDAQPRAERSVEVEAEKLELSRATALEEITLPADPAVLAALAEQYLSADVGSLRIYEQEGAMMLDPGVWKSGFGTKRNPDGTTSLVLTDGGMLGLELIVGEAQGKRTLILNDAQQSFLFVEVAP